MGPVMKLWVIQQTNGVTYLILASLSIILGCFMNIAFIIVIFKGKKMRNTVNTYLLNLAIADTIYLVVTIFMLIDDYVIGLFPLLQFLALYTSLLIVTAVSIERYYAVCKQRVYRAGNRRQRTLIISASAWIIAFILVSGLLPRYLWHSKAFQKFTKVYEYFICILYFAFVCPVFCVVCTNCI